MFLHKRKVFFVICDLMTVPILVVNLLIYVQEVARIHIQLNILCLQIDRGQMLDWLDCVALYVRFDTT